MWFKLLNGGEVPSTIDNLKAAAQGENDEWTDMYPEMARVAKEEGFDRIAYLFDARNCGHIHVGEKAPEVCPVCSHPKAYFEIREENY